MKDTLGKSFKTLNPRKKVIYAGGVYHLIQRAPGRELIFISEKDYLYFLRILKEYSKKYRLDIFSFALLPNHLHILLRINEDNLSLAMQSMLTKYAMYFNKKYQRRGHVFQGNYRAFLCLNDRYLITATIYIHLNPFKAGLTKDPHKYKWSSLEVFLSPEVKSFIQSKYILEIIAKDKSYASQIYKKMIGESSQTNFKVYTDNFNFFRRALNSIFLKIGSFSINRRGKGNKELDIWTEEIIEDKIQELKRKGRLRRKEDIKVRNYLIQQLRANGFSMSEIASKLGVRRQAIYQTFNLPF